MATTTSNFGLRKPASSDTVNVAADIAANMDLIDAHAHSGTYVALISATEQEITSRLRIKSDLSGGTTSDSTNRITIEAYQRPQSPGASWVGEGIRLDLMKSNAKNMIAWRMARPPTMANPTAADMRTTVWIGAHYESQNLGDPVHGHWSIEIPDSTDALQTRLELPFIDPDTEAVGVDTSNFKTNKTHFTIAADSGMLRIAGNANTRKKILEFSTDRNIYDTTPWDPIVATPEGGARWRLLCDNDTEAGSMAGSNLRITRHSDVGTQMETAMYIERSSGRVDFGAPSPLLARVTSTVTTTETHGFGAHITLDPGNAAGFHQQSFASTNRFLDVRVTGDTNGRFATYTDGKLEWGDGATSRDTNLYRSAANVLKTDDSFLSTLSLTGTTGVTAGVAAGSGTMSVSVVAAAGNIRQLGLYSGATQRWGVAASNGAESGSNVGTDLNITAYDDAGASLGHAITIVRSSKQVVVNNSFKHAGTTLGFYNATTTTKPTGVAVTAAGIHAALVTLGLIAA
jgi:hypothetical protein